MKQLRSGLVLLMGLLTLGLMHAQAPMSSEIAKAHDEKVYTLAFAPDGKTFASGGFDNLIKIWDWPSLKELRKLPGHTNNVYCVAFNNDGTLLASSSQDKTIRLWNPAEGKLLRELKGHTDQVDFVAFSPDGKILASTSADKTVRLWNPADGKETKNLGSHAKGAYMVAFSPDGKLLASAGADMIIKIWDVAAGKEAKQLKGHTDAVTGVAWHPTQPNTLVSIGHDRSVRVWDVAAGKETKQLGEVDEKTKAVAPLEDDPYGIAFSKDGKLATSGYGGYLKIWDLNSGKALQTIRLNQTVKNRFGAYCVVFSPDGKSVLTGHDQKMILITPVGK